MLIGGGRFLGLETRPYSSNDALAVLVVIEYPGDEDGPGEVESFPISINLDYAENPVKSKDLPKGQFFAKDYSEGTKIFNALVNEGLIEVVPDSSRVATGYVTVPICRLTEKGTAALPRQR